MSKKRKVLIVIIAILILLAGTFAVYKIMNPKKENTKITKKLDSIKGFDYVLEDRDTELYKDEFKSLKTNLESKSIDYKEYAKSIAKMFIIDLYTINNKVNKYDVGGLEFVHPDALENYELNVKDTLYKYVDDNSYGDREQELPEVSSIKVDNIKESTYKIGENEIDSYELSLSWDYVKDLEYDSKATIIIVKKDKYLYIVEKKDIEEDSKTE